MIIHLSYEMIRAALAIRGQASAASFETVPRISLPRGSPVSFVTTTALSANEIQLPSARLPSLLLAVMLCSHYILLGSTDLSLSLYW